ncbi:hypothetical protein HO133_003409 [Letharia lupina]|uniref:Uncharacterized protein n=1 Tax=Letharia lupina TaxID=560253 RepID=A0A8H6CB55_9LECA|nr:uncharacterized protein HO133_003409 [Letharia lupina]KAF6220277.1 hypothetical protein HO133_003409 [Letharia lupina]
MLFSIADDSATLLLPLLCLLFAGLLTSVHSLHVSILKQKACPQYANWARQSDGKELSEGRYQLPFQRPSDECRTFYSQEVEDAIERLRPKIADPDLFRLFENAFPNTLDTAVKWKGFAWKDEQEGDSANQILSYLPVLQASEDPNSLAALFRGVINVQSRYIKITPHCHAFQPPPESGINVEFNGAYTMNTVRMFGKLGYDQKKTISSDYYNATGDIGPFEKYLWMDTVEVILAAAEAMRTATYTPDGHIAPSGYTMKGKTDRATETTSNDGIGNPVIYTGMVRSTFRPSDDATIFQYLIPSNMMFARYLEEAGLIMQRMDTQRSRDLESRMQSMASEIRAGITKYGVVSHPLFGAMFAFEVDGYGSQNAMDDANLPSLLPASMMGYVSPRDEVYMNTRLFALSEANPYWAFGNVFNAIGGPHTGPTKAWPLASIVRVLTSGDINGEEQRDELRTILRFGWANGMFGQMILDIEARMPHILDDSYQ